ncbi:MAG: helix-turn-helix domain-containing protein [Betaproteobacteria bacterium]|nr:helix-turn-helix domain-containing protein [Betaproteobacteria bacterium]
MRQPRNETAALIRAAAQASGGKTVSALAKRLDIPLRTMQEWAQRDRLPGGMRLLLAMLAAGEWKLGGKV